MLIDSMFAGVLARDLMVEAWLPTIVTVTPSESGAETTGSAGPRQRSRDREVV